MTACPHCGSTEEFSATGACTGCWASARTREEGAEVWREVAEGIVRDTPMEPDVVLSLLAYARQLDVAAADADVAVRFAIRSGGSAPAALDVMAMTGAPVLVVSEPVAPWWRRAAGRAAAALFDRIEPNARPWWRRLLDWAAAQLGRARELVRR